VSDVTPILRKLESWAIEELGAQRRTLERLQQQHAALRDGDPTALEARGREIDGESAAGIERAARRSALLRLLGVQWGVDPKSLTLASVAERCGREGERLARLRSDLRRAAAATARALRGNVRAARAHQRAWGEILSGLLSSASSASDLHAGGQLVDAEA
jgi:hypothetical protein